MGTPLLVLAVLLAVAIPVLTMLTWARIRGPRPVRGGVRLGLLLVGQVATVAAAAVAVNDYGQFYTSWSGLLGIQGPPPAVATYGAPTGPARRGDPPRAHQVPAFITGPPIGRLTLHGNTTWSSRAQWRSRGEVASATVTGLRSGLSTHAFVYLPPQYFWSKDAHRRFPAVEVLTGYPGSALNLVSRMNYPGLTLALVQEHRAHPMILVMLSPNVAPPRDTECTNIPGGPQAQTFLGSELPSAVGHALRVQPGHWGVVGDSTGGYCAAKLAMLQPSLFRGGVSLSGYYHALNGGTAGNLFGGSAAARHANDLRWRLAHRPVPPARLYVTISKQETSASEGYPETMRFLHLVRPPMRVTAVIEQAGGHNFETWNAELPRAMTWLSAQVSGQTGRHAVHPPVAAGSPQPHGTR